MPDTIDIPVSQPGASPGVSKMPMQDSTALMFEQAFAKSHAIGLAAMDRENQSMGFIAEQSKLNFLTADANSDLAQTILGQRSSSQQPQVGVIPAVKTVAS